MYALLALFMSVGFLMHLFGVRAVVLVATMAVGLFVAREALVRRKPMKLLELGSFILFAAVAFASAFVQSVPYRAAELWLLGGVAAMIVGSILIGRPFTLEYAMDLAPSRFAVSPWLRKVHNARSGAWALFFSGLAAPSALRYVRGATRVEATSLVVAATAGALFLFEWRPQAFDKRGPTAYLAIVTTFVGLARRFGNGPRRRP